MMLNTLPKHRLDAGSFGTMGVGLGFAIAAALYVKDNFPSRNVPPTSLLPTTKYEKFAEMLGFSNGSLCRTVDDIQNAYFWQKLCQTNPSHPC